MTNKMVDRRTFLKTTSAAAAASTAAAGAARGAETQDAKATPNRASAPAAISRRHELTIAPASGWFATDSAAQLSRDIAISTDNRVILRMSNERKTATAESIARGDLDGAIGGLPEICVAPELALFTGLPGDLAVSPDLLTAWHGAAGGDMFLDEATTELGLKAFLVGHSGPQPGLWSDRDVADLQSFAGARIETVGLGTATCQVLHDAFVSADIDAVQATLTELPVPAMLASSVLEPAKRRFWYRGGLHPQGVASALVISQRQWEKLAAADQLIVETLSRLSLHNAMARNRVNERFVSAALLAATPDLTPMPLPADISVAIKHAAMDTVHNAMPANPVVSRAFSAYTTFFEEMMGFPLPKPLNGAVASA